MVEVLAKARTRAQLPELEILGGCGRLLIIPAPEYRDKGSPELAGSRD